MEPVIELNNVWKIYKTGSIETPALRGVNLVVGRGDFISIMGPSGSGKSTLLNIIGLLDKPTRGEVRLAGRDISKLSGKEMAYYRNYYLGFVFQRFNLVGRLSVRENIELPLIARGVPRSERLRMVVKALSMAGGDESWLEKKPTQLSGGQQQRVAIARAIVGNPLILLADEPTGNLDRASAKVVMETFQALNSRGLSIVLVTHDPEVANCSERIYVIRDGVIIGSQEPVKSRCITKTMGG
jgi:putative ABC transport system ATP-binding protein